MGKTVDCLIRVDYMFLPVNMIGSDHLVTLVKALDVISTVHMYHSLCIKYYNVISG